ncbi:MAG TPA: SDR family oxidoreductase [Burkholderiaceae bacterium]|jgi:NAD(P)-dependent dehydrogenase (short-subunit alcohol dehydrogenase family)|nr:SDR family oxidoreductase [Burkholderiaceae bacterium]
MATKALAGRTALITGGAGGIGAACAERLVDDGAAVLLMGRRTEVLQAARQSLLCDRPGARVECHVGDACRSADMSVAVQQAAALQGSLDIVVATVGGGGFRPLLMHDAASFMAELQQNLLSAFLAVREAAPLMAGRGGGSIVCISSNAARLSFRWLSAYCTAKSGLEGFVRAAADELASAGVRINAVRPGLTRSEATGPMFDSPALREKFVEQMPLGRLGEPQDIAGAVRYLAGPESAWVTGQSLAVDGGNELRMSPALDDAVAALYGDEALRAVRAGRAPTSTPL